MKLHLLLLLSAALPAAAIPANDAFAARVALGSAAVVSTTGDNTGATLQPDENDLDSIGGASVWWKWTAPASGWVSVDTAGSAIDTVLAVLTDGPGLDDAYVVGCNDESGDPSAPPGSSRVVFSATAGLEYHIAVHGFLGEQGAVNVNIRAGLTPPLRITSLSLTPGAVNVTAAAQTVTAEIGIAADAGLEEGVLALHRANFSGVTEVPLPASSRISGTAAAGVYRVSFTIPRYATPGTWLAEIAASDTLGREAVFGRGVSALFEYDHVLPDGFPALLSVANTGAVDETAPALASYTLSPSAVNVAASPANLTFTFRLTDALSGVGGAVLTLYTPDGESLTVLPVTAAQRTLGTALDGTYSISFTLPAKMPGGTWRTSLLVRDAAQNPALFDGAVDGESFPPGVTGRLSVTGAPHSYWAWMYPRLADSPGTLPADDLDGDGTGNLLEYAFGLTVDENDSVGSVILPDGEPGGLPVFAMTVDGLTLSYPRRTATGLSYSAQFSTDFNTWISASGGVITPGAGAFEQVTVSDPQPGTTRRFGRLNVSLAD